jgi:hypothetical protein
MTDRRERALALLLLFNLTLQIFDGVATYFGVRSGMPEGNPIVAATLVRLGMIPALCLVKMYACGCLLLIWHLRQRSRLAFPALVTTAAAYTVCSAAPWSAALAAL